MESVIKQLKEVAQKQGVQLPRIKDNNDLILFFQKMLREAKKKVDKNETVKLLESESVLKTSEYISSAEKDVQKVFMQIITSAYKTNKALVGVSIHYIIDFAIKTLEKIRKGVEVTLELLEEEEKEKFKPVIDLYAEILAMFKDTTISNDDVLKGLMDIAKAYAAKNLPNMVGMFESKPKESAFPTVEELKLKMKRLKKQQRDSRKKNVK